MTDIGPDAVVADVVQRYPATGPILLQHGSLFRVRPGSLYPEYSPPLTLREFAEINRVELTRLLALLRRASEEGQALPGYEVPERKAPPSGSLGYTGSYREPGPADAEATPMASTLAKRLGPE
jgi:hypothetical protein